MLNSKGARGSIPKRQTSMDEFSNIGIERPEKWCDEVREEDSAGRDETILDFLERERDSIETLRRVRPPRPVSVELPRRLRASRALFRIFRRGKSHLPQSRNRSQPPSQEGKPISVHMRTCSLNRLSATVLSPCASAIVPTSRLTLLSIPDPMARSIASDSRRVSPLQSRPVVA